MTRTTGTIMWLLLLLYGLSVALSLSVVYTSRFSSMLETSNFKSKLGSLLCDTDPDDTEEMSLKKGRLCLIPTAQFAFNKDSDRSRGEQRRRARYDAKNKAAEIAKQLDLTGGDPM